MKRITLSPSHLGWLRADCERCLVREVAYGVKRPGGPPEAYNLADKAMKTWFDDRHDAEISLGVGPTFRVVAQGQHVESRPLEFPNYDLEIVVKGRLDALVRTTDDETIVVDYKTTTKGEVAPRTYTAQLHAYAFALESPARAADETTIDGLALLLYRPVSFSHRPEKAVSGLYGPTEWLEVPRDDASLHQLLERVAALSVGAVQPTPNPKCMFCTYYGAVPLERVAVGGAA